MGGFFLLAYLVITAPSALTVVFALAVPVPWLACFFDGFHIRRRINADETVEDGVGNILSGILRNKKLSLILLVIITIAWNIAGVAFELTRRVVPILLLVLVMHVIFRKKIPLNKGLFSLQDELFYPPRDFGGGVNF